MRGRSWLLIGVSMAAVVAMPNTAGEADFGPWHFTVTAEGNVEFREVYSFRARRACEEQRNTLRRGVARVLAEQPEGAAGRAARRLHIGQCEGVRRGR